MTNSTVNHRSLTDDLKGKVVVTDTSSLLMAGTGILKVLNNCSLVIPAMVVKELEEKRTHTSVGHFAREWLRLIEKLRVENGKQLAKSVQLVDYDELTLSIEPNHRNQQSLPEYLRDGSHDSTILAVAMNLKDDENVQGPVVLLSNDGPMRFYATLDLDIEAYEFNANAIVPAKPFDGTYTITLSDEQYGDSLEKNTFEKTVLQQLPKDRASHAYVKVESENGQSLSSVLVSGDKVTEVKRKQRVSRLVGRTVEQDIAIEYLRRPYDDVSIVSLQGKAGSGKMELLTNVIPVPVNEKFPQGKTTIGELSIGDQVYDNYGKPTRIIDFSQIEEQKVYKVVFSDGRYSEVGADHLWSVYDQRDSLKTETKARRRKNSYEDVATRIDAAINEYGAGFSAKISTLARILRVSQSMVEEASSKIVSDSINDAQVWALDEIGEKIKEILLNTQPDNIVSKVKTTVEMMNDYKRSYEHGGYNYFVHSEPLAFDDNNDQLIVQPYILGAWLGDGSAADSAVLSGKDIEIFDIFDKYYERGYTKKVNDCFYVSYKKLVTDLKKIGIVYEKLPSSHSRAVKTIPISYKRASFENRLELLQGLMDTDGYIDENGYSRLKISNRTLADDTLELIRSLGIRASIHEGTQVISGTSKKTKENYSYDSPYYTINFKTSLKTFKISRKSERIQEEFRTKENRVFIVDIQETEQKEEMRCLFVESSNHMYLTSDFIPTHNTLLTIATGLDELASGNYQKLIVFRSLHSRNGQEMGFLPGNVDEKMAAWAGAVYDAIDVIASKKVERKGNQGPHADKKLEAEVNRLREMVEVSPITYLRGRSLANSYLVLEEAQNFSRSEILNILSRAGEGSKIVFTFDDMQVDNKFLQTGAKADIWSVIESLKSENLFAHVSLKHTERSRVAEIASRIIEEG